MPAMVSFLIQGKLVHQVSQGSFAFQKNIYESGSKLVHCPLRTNMPAGEGGAKDRVWLKLCTKSSLIISYLMSHIINPIMYPIMYPFASLLYSTTCTPSCTHVPDVQYYA